MSTNHTLFTLAFILFTYRLKLGTSVLIRAALQTAVLAPLITSRANWYYFAAMIVVINPSDLAIGARANTGDDRSFRANNCDLVHRRVQQPGTRSFDTDAGKQRDRSVNHARGVS